MPQGPLATLPDELLTRVVTATVEPDLRFADWGSAAAQLARLRPVNRAFSHAADAVQEQYPALLARAERARRTETILQATLNEYNERRTTTSLAGIRGMEHVTVDMRCFRVRSRLGNPQDMHAVAADFRNALHDGPRALDVVAERGTLMNNMLTWLTSHPGLLRSLDMDTRPPYQRRDETFYAGLNSPWHLSRALLQQKNLTELTLRHGCPINSRRNERLDMLDNRLANAIAALPNLERLSLGNVGNNADVLAQVLRSLPGLKVLNLVADRRNEPGLDAAAFAPVVSALGTLRSLRCLHLERILPDGTSARQLADAVSGLPELQTLKLAGTGLDAAGLELVARGLAGLKKLRAVDLSGEPLPLGSGTGLIQALANVPTLQTLSLCCAPDGDEQRGTDAAALASTLAPLARRPDLRLHLEGLDPARLSRLRGVLPQAAGGFAPGPADPDTRWDDRLRRRRILTLA